MYTRKDAIVKKINPNKTTVAMDCPRQQRQGLLYEKETSIAKQL